MRRVAVGKPLLAIVVLCGLVASVIGSGYGKGYGGQSGYGGYGGYGYGGYGGNMYGGYGGYSSGYGNGGGYGGYNHGKGTALYIPVRIPVPSIPYPQGNYGSYGSGILPIILLGASILFLLVLLNNNG